MVSSGYMIMSHCQYNFPTVSPVFSVLSCPDFNIFMANDRVEWGMGQWNKSTIHSFIATFMSLSKALLASESWDFAVSGWAESDEKDMWWNAGNLITGSLPTETQPAYLLSQELQTYTGSAGSFQVPLTNCSAQMRSEVNRPESAYTFLSWSICPFFLTLIVRNPPRISATPGL